MYYIRIFAERNSQCMKGISSPKNYIAPPPFTDLFTLLEGITFLNYIKWKIDTTAKYQTMNIKKNIIIGKNNIVC